MSIAVIGAHAKFGRGQGGGSATVYPKEFVGPLEGLRANVPAGTTIDFALGAHADSSLIHFDKNTWRNPDDGVAGCKAEIFDKEGNLVFSEQRYAGFYNWTAEPWVFTYDHIKVSGIFTADQDGTYEFGIGMVGNYTVRINGEEHTGFKIGRAHV